MLEIDGGDGGGQVFRSAVGLAAVTGRPVRVENVRGTRSDPGLKHQHLAALEAVARCCDAAVEGASLGSETVTFEPGAVRGGEVGVDVPTAGSVMLVFDAVLPLATVLDEPLTVRASGGTDVAWSPSSTFYRRVKLPLLARCGLVGSLAVQRHGFYPRGGGQATLSLAPAELDRIDLAERGDGGRMHVASLCSRDLAPADVALRQATAAIERLRDADVPVVGETVSVVDAPTPGSAVLVRAEYGGAMAGFDALGEKGRPAEDVGEAAAERAIEHHGGTGVVDVHLADQILPFLALAGGRVGIPAVTEHVETHLDLLSAFGFEVGCEKREDGAVVTADEVVEH